MTSEEPEGLESTAGEAYHGYHRHYNTDYDAYYWRYFPRNYKAHPTPSAEETAAKLMQLYVNWAKCTAG